jgi:hypothetical protein
MRIMIKCHFRVCIPQLALRDFGSGARFKQARGVHVTKRVKTCTRNLQRMAQRPQPFLDDLSQRCIRLTYAIGEQKTGSPIHR